MKKLLSFISLCWVFHNLLPAQNAGLSIVWTGTLYEVRMEVVNGASNLLLGSSQVSIVMPSSIPLTMVAPFGITVNCLTPCATPWGANTLVTSGGSHYVAIANVGGQMGPIANNSTVPLFRFSLPGGGCNANVRLFNNTTDPYPLNQQDFRNTLVNGLAEFDFYNGSNDNNVICAAAPVDLLYFNAQYRENGIVRISWNTQNEDNMTEYDLQRSLDGQRFSKLGVVPAQNTPEASYEWLDKQLPPGIARLFYRLQSVENDGTITHSPVRIVELPNTPFLLTIAPVPSSDQVTLGIQTDRDERALVEVRDETGRLLYSQRYEMTEGGNRIQLSVLAWPSGTYIASVRTDRHRAEQRLIVQR
jgi:hypothetical protein